MVDAARDCGEQIGGIGISKGCRLIDGVSRRMASRGERRRNSEHVFLLIGDAEWIGDEKGALRRCLDGAICRTAQSAGALRNKIGIVLYLARDFVEQLVDGDEAWPAHVPMRLFHLSVQIDRRGQWVGCMANLQGGAGTAKGTAVRPVTHAARLQSLTA